METNLKNIESKLMLILKEIELYIQQALYDLNDPDGACSIAGYTPRLPKQSDPKKINYELAKKLVKPLSCLKGNSEDEFWEDLNYALRKITCLAPRPSVGVSQLTDIAKFPKWFKGRIGNLLNRIDNDRVRAHNESLGDFEKDLYNLYQELYLLENKYSKKFQVSLQNIDSIKEQASSDNETNKKIHKEEDIFVILVFVLKYFKKSKDISPYDLLDGIIEKRLYESGERLDENRIKQNASAYSHTKQSFLILTKLLFELVGLEFEVTPGGIKDIFDANNGLYDSSEEIILEKKELDLVDENIKRVEEAIWPEVSKEEYNEFLYKEAFGEDGDKFNTRLTSVVTKNISKEKK